MARRRPPAKSRISNREGDEELACQRDDHRFARAGTAIGSAGLVPQCQCALLLKQQEAPSELDHAAADPARCRLWRAHGGIAVAAVRPPIPPMRFEAPLAHAASACNKTRDDGGQQFRAAEAGSSTAERGARCGSQEGY
jgi:hypothetical protein